MTAHDLMTFLRELERRGIALETLEVNFRQDFDSDVFQVAGVCEDLYDAETSSRLTSIVLYAEEVDADLDAPHTIPEDFAV
jgi:hypothetical protein